MLNLSHQLRGRMLKWRRRWFFLFDMLLARFSATEPQDFPLGSGGMLLTGTSKLYAIL